MPTFIDGIQKLWEWLKTQIPAIAISLFQYEEGRIAQKEREKDALKLKVELGENKNAVDKKFDGLSDTDIVLQSIRDGSSGGSDQGPASSGGSESSGQGSGEKA